MGRLCYVVMMLWALTSAYATAQDIPGLEVCTAEKQMERRTGCLQSNDEYLQQTLSKLARETQAKLAASQAEIAALKSAMEKLNSEMVQMKSKVEPASKK